MRRRFDNQLMLDLAPVKRRLLPGTAPEGLLQALADLRSSTSTRRWRSTSGGGLVHDRS